MENEWNIRVSQYSRHDYIESIKVIGGDYVDSGNYRRALGWFESAGKETPPDFRYSSIQLTLSGEGTLFYNGKEYIQRPGTAFMVHMMDKKSSWYYKEESGKPWNFIYLEIYGESFRKFVDEVRKISGPCFHFDVNCELITRLTSFKHIASEKNWLSLSEQQKILGEVKSIILDESSREVSGNVFIERTISEINRSISENLTVNELARRLNVSREYLSRQFRKHLKISPYNFILQKRLQEAGELLRHSSLSVKQVSNRMGFSSSTIFGRQFNRVFGMTPSQFRQIK